MSDPAAARGSTRPTGIEAMARPRRPVAVLAVAIAVTMLITSSPVSTAAASVRSGPQDDARAREAAAASALEESSAEVRAAGAALATVARELPRAQAAVSASRGRMIGARAKAASALDRATQARAAVTRARAEVEAASARVGEQRRDVGNMARRAYQQGRWSGLRALAQAERPQDALVRAQMLRSVLRFGDRSLQRLTDERLALAGQTAGLAALQREAETAREQAADAAEQAEDRVRSAAAAADRVRVLVSQRRDALVAAERLRAQDQREYQAAQAASQALAERIRAAAARQAAARLAAERREAASAAAAPRSAPSGRTPRSGRMLWPSDGPMTSPYGYRTHPIYGDRRLHAGIDIGSGAGADIIAATAGTVLLSYFSESYGNLIVIDHGTIGNAQVSTAYAHQSQRLVQEGQRVSAGEVIGRVGNTGNSAGPHLHFEVREDGDPVDPMTYVDEP